MQKVILTGPESSGKTTLANALAAYYRVPVVPEYARIFLEKLNSKNYTYEDFVKIALGQHLQEQTAIANATKAPIILDTSFLVLKIWSEVKYGHCEPFILEHLQRHHDALFILCAPDIEWEADPLRENPKDRDKLFIQYQKTLKTIGFDYIIANGSRDNRLKNSLLAISQRMP